MGEGSPLVNGERPQRIVLQTSQIISSQYTTYAIKSSQNVPPSQYRNQAVGWKTEQSVINLWQVQELGAKLSSIHKNKLMNNNWRFNL
jgi:hypothetical protein